MSGILGCILLAVYFLAAPPLPPANATVAQVVSVATQYHDTWFLGAWFQATGTLLSVIFFLSLVHMASATAKFAGTLTLLGATALLVVTLIEGAFTIDLAQAAVNGHAETSLTSYDIMSVFLHIFPIVPAPLIYISLGIVLIGSHVLPRAFGYLAVALGIIFEVVGVVGLLVLPVLVLVALGLQALWILAAAITLIVARPPQPTVAAPTSAQAMVAAQ